MNRPSLLAVVLVLTACAADRIAAPRNDLAQIRLANAASVVADLGLRVDGAPVVSGVATSGISGFVDVPAGLRQLEVTVPGLATPVVLQSVTLEKDLHYTFVFTGSLSNPLGYLASDTAFIPNPGKGKLRVLHAAPSAPALDVYLSAYGDPLSSAFRLVDPFLPYADTAAFPGFIELDPGGWHLRFTGDNTLTVLLDSGPIALAAGQVLTAILTQTDSAGLALRVIDETPSASPQAVFVHLVHAAPGAPALDAHVFAGGESFADPHWQFPAFAAGFDSVLYVPAHQASGALDVTVVLTDHATNNPVHDTGPILIPKGERRRVTLQPKPGGGLELVVVAE